MWNNEINKIIMKEILSSASEKASLVDELDSILETSRINIIFESLVCWAAKVWSRHINYSGVSRQRGRVRVCVPVSVLLICCNCCNCQMSRCGHCHCCPVSGPTLRTTLPLHTALWVLTCTIIKCNTCFWWWYVLIAIYPDADTACCRLASVPHYALHCHCTAHCAMGTNN